MSNECIRQGRTYNYVYASQQEVPAQELRSSGNVGSKLGQITTLTVKIALLSGVET
jgi:hypothetical protein